MNHSQITKKKEWVIVYTYEDGGYEKKKGSIRKGGEHARIHFGRPRPVNEIKCMFDRNTAVFNILRRYQNNTQKCGSCVICSTIQCMYGAEFYKRKEIDIQNFINRTG